MKKKQIKNNSFLYGDRFRGKVGADYVRSMIAPQDEAMSAWLNDRITVGRFGTKQMTQLFEYALENPTPEFFAYLMRKLLKHFGISDWELQYTLNPSNYKTWLESEAQLAHEKLKYETDHTLREGYEAKIKSWENYQIELKRYTRFCECFLHGEDWSVEQELEIGSKRNEVKFEAYRRQKIKEYHSFLPTTNEEDSYFYNSQDQKDYDEWEKQAPKHFISALKMKAESENTKRLLDDAEQRVEFAQKASKDVIYYERINDD